MTDDILDPRDAEFKAWPMLTYYYGLGFQDLMLMPRWLKQSYMLELPRFIGRDRLRAAEASVLPHIEQPARDAAFAHMRAQAGITIAPVVIDKPKFDGTLRGIGINVKRAEGKSRGRRKPKAKPGQRMVPTPEPEVTDA